LAALAENRQRYGLRVLGYCLMTNHAHLVVVPDRADSLRLTLQRTQSHYAQRFNRRYGRSGHLWQGRFFSCPLGRDHLVTALAYVDLNPLRAHLVGRADHYPWSSAAAHLAGHDEGGLLDLELWREVPSAMHWADALELPPTEQQQGACARPPWQACRSTSRSLSKTWSRLSRAGSYADAREESRRARLLLPDFGL
jgi:putative transposase